MEIAFINFIIFDRKNVSIMNKDRTVFFQDHLKRLLFAVTFFAHASFMKSFYFPICLTIKKHPN